MDKAKFSDDFKRDTVHQITVRGYPVAEISRRLGVSVHSLYAWVKKFSKPFEANTKDERAAENRRLIRELERVTEERDIQKFGPLTTAHEICRSLYWPGRESNETRLI